MPLSLNQSELVDLTRFLALEIEQIQEGSLLCDHVVYLEEFDLKNGTNLIQVVKDAIAELILIEDKIALLQDDKAYGGRDHSVTVNGEYRHSLSFGSRRNIDSGQKARMTHLIRQIKRLLKWQSPINKICLG